MGGHGSGRKPSAGNVFNSDLKPTATADFGSIQIPNLSGVKEDAKKSDSSTLLTDSNIPDFATSGHTHATADVTSGTFADARISESSVTQHEAAIDHDALTNFVAAEHVTASAFATSGGATQSLGTHIADSSDPHGSTLTQTTISLGGNIIRTGDTNTTIQGSSDQWNIVTGASTRMTINNSGVQIANGILDMNSNNITEGGTITAGTYAGAGVSAFATSGGATTSLGVHVADSTDPHGSRLTQTNLDVTGDLRADSNNFIISGGRVGIGTTNPSELLEVSGGNIQARNAGNVEVLIQDTTASNEASLHIKRGTADWYMAMTTGSDLDIRYETTDVMTFDSATLNVGIGTTAPAAKLHVDQPSTTGAIPVLYLDQADISEEMIEFNTTIGTGNAIEAVGAKTLTTTHFIKVTLPGGLTRYIPCGTIA